MPEYGYGQDQSRLNGDGRPGPQMPAPPSLQTRIAVVGYGYWGSKHVRVLTSLPGVAVTVVDSVPARRAEAAVQYPSADVCADLDEALECVDAVLVATPPGTHAEVSLRAIRAGRHVLVEKPMATSVHDAEAMVAAAAAADVQLMVGHTYLYNAAVRKLKEIVLSGELGRVLYVDSARLGLGRYQSDCNVVWDLAPHDISILAFLLDELPQTVSVWAHRNVGDLQADVAYLRLGFEGAKINAFVRVSWLDPYKCRRATVVGDRKMVVYDDMSDSDRLRIYDINVDPDAAHLHGEMHAMPVSFRTGDIVSPYINFAEPLLVQDSHFLDCIRTGRRPDTPGTFGLDVVRVLAAIDLAHRSGNAVLLPATTPARSAAPALEVV